MKIILAGDSTVANCPEHEAPMAGWGQYLSDYLAEDVQVNNIAKGGSTTVSFREEGRWETVCGLIEENDIVCIQFGHNDQKPEKKIYSQDFYRNLSKMVLDVKDRKGQPILLTPPERNNFFRNQLFPTLEKEATIIQKVAEENQMPCIQLHHYTKRCYQENGEEKNRDYFMWTMSGEFANYPQGYQDNTHFKESGARLIAEWVAQELKKYLHE